MFSSLRKPQVSSRANHPPDDLSTTYIPWATKAENFPAQPPRRSDLDGDFGSNKLIWTLVANGQTAFIPANLDPLWEISPFLDATGMTPPSIRFEGGASVRGPRQVSTALSTTVANPLTLKAWVSDEAKIPPGMQRPKIPPVILTWSKFRGPGVVTFTNAKPPVEEAASDTAPLAAYSGRCSHDGHLQRAWRVRFACRG